jgi:hypothetical protein
MACKFKVGDKVKANRLSDGQYYITRYANHWEGEVVAVGVFGWTGDDRDDIKVRGIGDTNEHSVHSKYFDLIVEPELHITVKGNETIGVYKHDGKTDRAVAKCSPEDTFDFATGVKLVCERLGVMPTESTPVRVNVHQYFTGRVICVQTEYDFWTKGKIYEVNNGEIRDNDNDPRYYMTLDHLERGIGLKKSPVKFIPVVE